MVDPREELGTRIFTCASIRSISWRDSSRRSIPRCVAISIQRLAPTCAFGKKENAASGAEFWFAGRIATRRTVMNRFGVVLVFAALILVPVGLPGRTKPPLLTTQHTSHRDLPTMHWARSTPMTRTTAKTLMRHEVRPSRTPWTIFTSGRMWLR